VAISEPRDALKKLWATYAEVQSPNGRPHTNGVAVLPSALPDDRKLLDKARSAKNGSKFAALYDQGDTSAYAGDDSRADEALCCHLAFWCDKDPARIDRLFRQSARFRDKWDERRGAQTYGERTIERAISLTAEVYTPSLPATMNEHAKVSTTQADQDVETVAPYPLESLPPVFRVLVEEGAASLVAPPDFIAVPLLVGAGAAIGNALEIALKPGWCEGANLYAACIGDPGSKKTPALNLAMRPVYHVQKRLRRDFEAASEAHREDVAIWEGHRKESRGPRPEPPTFRHLVTTDATTEAVAGALATSKGLLLTKDELTGWVRSMDQYRAGGKGADRQHYLSMWSRSFIKVDRKSNPVPIIVERPHLSVVGGIQPDLLPELADAAKREDGFLDRLLLSYPDKVQDHWSNEGVRIETLQAVEAVFERLYALGGGGAPSVTIRLSAAAHDLWVPWYAENAEEQTQETFPRRLVGPWAKMPAQLARLALILHAVESPDSCEISEDTLARACDLIDYHKAHARLVYKHLGEQRRDGKLTILKALKEGGPLKQWDILGDVFKRNVSASLVTTWLEELEEAGLVTREIRQGGTGRPATIWTAV
jgi:hypothetical protein